jgi:hypothetical protein
VLDTQTVVTATLVVKRDTSTAAKLVGDSEFLYAFTKDIWRQIGNDESDQAIKPEDPAKLLRMAQRMDDARKAATNESTAAMDESYIAKWLKFCTIMGTNPNRTTDFAGERIPRWQRIREESLQHDCVVW